MDVEKRGHPIPSKDGDQVETERKYLKSVEAMKKGEGTDGDRYNISEWEWDHEPNGDQRR